MAILASDLVKRKKEHVFVEGYEIDAATELTGGIDATSDVVHVYGIDDGVKDVTINTGTLTLTVYDKKTNNVLLDALQRIDPADTSEKRYNWNNIYNASVWANRFNTENTQYTRSVFYGNWLPIPAATSGDTNAKGIRTFTGNCDVMREYTQPIYGEKLELTTGATGDVGTATLSYTPETVDPSVATGSRLYAIRVVAVQETRAGGTIRSIAQEDITDELDTSMVTAGAAVSIDFGADCDVLTWATHVYVNYLYNRTTGVHPAVSNVGMYAQIQA